ncbi:Na+/H+ antiporter subunit C [Limimaricola sp.]|uniref:Na+/H+ antiporter subunit C n=1 Tax=Limimaricola sp. TaxID=2211665 RepID=UPI004058E2EE
MELLIATAVGALTAAGIYLVLRLRTFPVIIGTSLLSYAVNVFLFASGRLALNAPPVLRDGAERYTDPLPQALVLTAIVISFGMTAVVVMIALGSWLSADDDLVDRPAVSDGDGRHPSLPEGDAR